jgi:hypothetical protein
VEWLFNCDKHNLRNFNGIASRCWRCGADPLRLAILDASAGRKLDDFSSDHRSSNQRGPRVAEPAALHRRKFSTAATRPASTNPSSE